MEPRDSERERREMLLKALIKERAKELGYEVRD